MNQLETNLVLWAICSILLFELLIVVCVCRCCFNRIKAKRFYVKREEYEYSTSPNGFQSYFQPIILRPPHADELALIGTIRTQNPVFNSLDDPFNSERPYSLSQHPIQANDITSPINLISSSTKKSSTSKESDYVLENSRFNTLPTSIHDSSFLQRKDTSTESFTGQNSISAPKSILKGNRSITPTIHMNSSSYSPSASIKINTCDSMYLESTINSLEQIHLPAPAFTDICSSSSSISPSDQMRFANVNRLNDISWEVPNEFKLNAYNLNNDDFNYQSAIIYRSNHETNPIKDEPSMRGCTSIEVPLNVSRIFIPWTANTPVSTDIYSNDILSNDHSQQHIFDY